MHAVWRVKFYILVDVFLVLYSHCISIMKDNSMYVIYRVAQKTGPVASVSQKKCQIFHKVV